VTPAERNILDTIIERKREEVRQRASRIPLDAIQEQAIDATRPRGFLGALRHRTRNAQPAVIAEIKKASPSRGVIRRDFEPASIARRYEASGAACLSVLTDEDFFQGSDEDLVRARAAVNIPVLRKDFIIDPYQVFESRVIGADCILLIAAALENEPLRELLSIAIQLDLDVLAEVHDEEELEKVLELDVALIGINNRDLRTFESTIDTTLNLLPGVPSDRLVVAESGISSPEAVAQLRASGVNAFLVGEAFMRAPDPGAALKELFFPED
jgi:indole-3-glycerol phosphate synthase